MDHQFLYSFTKNIPDTLHNQTIIIGNFDGVHIGHQQLIDQAKCATPERNVVILTFRPHPKVIFHHDLEYFMISTPQQKYKRLKEEGVSAVVEIPFDREFAKLSGEKFISMLINMLQPKNIYVGEDFCFGNQRTGNAELLSNLSQAYGYKLHVIKKFHNTQNICYSSSAIREHIKQGHISAANQLLGYNWIIEGKVIHGDKRGRSIGFPTANIDISPYLLPKPGVYCVKVHINQQTYRAVTNIGYRPTFKTKKPLLEVHIFEFSEDIYGQFIQVEFLDFLRAEKKFNSLQDLTSQIQEDCIQAKDRLSI